MKLRMDLVRIYKNFTAMILHLMKKVLQYLHLPMIKTRKTNKPISKINVVFCCYH